MIEDDNINQDFNTRFERPPIFCGECGDLLDFEIITEFNVVCQKCEGEVEIDNITNHYTETIDSYHTSKTWMNKLANIEDKYAIRLDAKRQIIDKPCGRSGCNSKKQYFYTQQTRSADEGSTVFYECVSCGHKDKENN